jgi:acetyl-CoA carboxylase biotin carboxyl carrier protein
LSKKKATNNPGGQSPASDLSGPMDVGLLERIVKLMAANDLNTVDVRDGDKRVILKRGAPTSTTAAHSNSVSAGNFSAPAPLSHPPAAESEDANLISIKSPMVGTFYSAGSPDAKPFVQVGSTVDEETDVCIIEAMKVFNNIKAETRGIISKILVSNGQTVEFGQPLFLVKP